ncbi:glycosyl hydrolase family 95 catalytic domain-containing protein [Paenibacillus sp. Soil766]|uniref:glycoside hydrolase family 95 protein n=1 Tax=Paenibacillus sp. Soil766 TaxID=1736404 RepID=UPI001F3D6706|nr:glycoside hydrolase family 95 protein [Paenibacillus sp. Soil766]
MMKLEYDSPGTAWKEALPIGNGRLGAMVFGAAETERIQINEETLWSGAPHDYNRPDAGQYLQEVRSLIFNDRIEEAERLFLDRMMGEPIHLQAYLPFCDLNLAFPGHREVTRYRRELDLRRAVATVSYEADGCEYTREIFCSRPSGCLVIRLSCGERGSIAVDASLSSVHPDASVQSDGSRAIRLTGRTGTRKGPRNWSGSWEGPGLRFEGRLTAFCEGGSCAAGDGVLRIAEASAITLVFSGATSFLNYRDMGGDPSELNNRYMARVSERPYRELLDEHVEDHKALYERVSIRLGGVGADERTGGKRRPTDRRVLDIRETEDPSLAALYFQFGRYLLIASSRPGDQPSNLQGIWNEEEWPEWGSKWTTNINVQMNYWPAEVGNLPECHLPLFDLIDDLRVTGARTAELYYGAKGFVVHHNTDLWRAAAPVDIHAGIWPMGGVWLVQHLWDHFEYNPDLDFLRVRAYPAMKEAARFVMDFLVEAPEGVKFAGLLITNPSYSPENAYRDGRDRRRHLTISSTMDVQLIRDLLERCLIASELLGENSAFEHEIRKVLDRIPPMQIGQFGQLQEWPEDWDRPEDSNGHVSHLYGLYPGNQIYEDTPETFEGARKSLELRHRSKDRILAWPAAWRIALHARLRDGESAHKRLVDLLAGSTNPNLLNQHEPFPMQIDANFGGTAGIAEMLLQSRSRYRYGKAEYEIELLPALPETWPEGSVSGFRARGGFEVGMTWAEGSLIGAEIRSLCGMPCTLRYRKRSIRYTLKAGESFQFDPFSR